MRRTAVLAIAGFLVASLMAATATQAAAQGSMRLDRSLPSNEKPSILKQVDVTQRLDAPLPLDLTFRDEAGRTVALRDLFRKDRPVIIAPVYYECPMLCTQTLNSLTTALGVIKLNPGTDFEVVAVSFDPKEPFGLARDKKAAYMAKYKRPGTEGGFHFLTGDDTSVAPLMAALGFKYQYDPAIDQYAHAAMIAVITPDGHVSKYFMGIDFSARDLRFALVDASQGHIGSAVERALITWCYHYDPSTGTYGLLTIRLVQAGGIATVAGMLVFWTVMWRREKATAAA
jgi:protein SCO1/2